MKIEEAIKEMRHGKVIFNSLFPEDKFRIEDGHLEVVNKEFPDGCHTSLNGDYITSDCWDVVEPEDPRTKGIHPGDKVYVIDWEDIYEPDDDWYAISIPKCITEKECLDIYFGYNDYVVKFADETTLVIQEVYKTVEEAQKVFKEKRKSCWESFHCDEMIEKLLKLKEMKDVK